MIEAARQYGTVHVIVNSDEWLTRKKGAPFMDWQERATIIEALRAVAAAWPAQDDDDTVVETLRRMRCIYHDQEITFCNGGDRTSGNTPEEAYCRSVGIELAYGVGGGKTQSSSALLAAHHNRA